MHGPSKASFADLARIFLGGLPGGIISRFLGVMTEADQGAIDAIGEALAGSGKPFVSTFGTLGAAGSRILTEDIEPDSSNPVTFARSRAEAKVKAFAARGVQATLIRLPPSVHGDGDVGFVPMIIGFARKHKVSAYVGDGSNRWPSVHRLDAAKLFGLALEKGEAGARYHGVADEGVKFRDIAEVIGRRLGLPVASKSGAEAARHFGFLSPFVALDNPTSSALTRAKLGWAPEQPGLIADIEGPGYFRT
jgi:nucleoside-diphosphate-sugar epimerase